jgi:hypothetical protein
MLTSNCLDSRLRDGVKIVSLTRRVRVIKETGKIVIFKISGANARPERKTDNLTVTYESTV